MAAVNLKITTKDGATESFSEPVGDNGVDYAMMDKALHRLQEQSNSFLTVHVEKEKAGNQTNQNNCDADDNDGESLFVNAFDALASQC